jgi:D-3-phosphoglycerate dehydrogenase
LAELSRRHDLVCGFNAGEPDLMRLIWDREVLVFRSGVKITAGVMESAPQLKLLVRAGSGLDNIDMEYVKKRGLELVRIPGPGARAVAELAFGLMLALARQILVADRSLREGHWAKHEVVGYLLGGKHLGIIGLGNIGSTAARMGVSWGMKVLGCVEHPSAERVADLAEAGVRLASFQEVLSAADYLCIFVPLKPSTRNLISAEELFRMKPGAFLINMARGEVVDETALAEALSRKGGLAGAALDVHKEEGENKVSSLAGVSNVVLTPHIGAMTMDTQREIGRRIVDIVRKFSEGGGLGQQGTG